MTTKYNHPSIEEGFTDLRKIEFGGKETSILSMSIYIEEKLLRKQSEMDIEKIEFDFSLLAKSPTIEIVKASSIRGWQYFIVGRYKTADIYCDKLYGINDSYDLLLIAEGSKILVSRSGDFVLDQSKDLYFYRFESGSFHYWKSLSSDLFGRYEFVTDFEDDTIEICVLGDTYFRNINTLQKEAYEQCVPARLDFNPFDNRLILSRDKISRNGQNIYPGEGKWIVIHDFTGPQSFIFRENSTSTDLFERDWSSGVVVTTPISEISWKLGNGIVLSKKDTVEIRYGNVVLRDSCSRIKVIDIGYDHAAFKVRDPFPKKIVIYKCQTLESQVEKIQNAIDLIDDPLVRDMLSVVGENLALEQRRQTRQ
jgi:hypothetical protein